MYAVMNVYPCHKLRTVNNTTATPLTYIGSQNYTLMHKTTKNIIAQTPSKYKKKKIH